MKLQKLIHKAAYLAVVKNKSRDFVIQDYDVSKWCISDTVTIDSPEQNITVTPAKTVQTDLVGLAGEAIIVDNDFLTAPDVGKADLTYEPSVWPARDWFGFRFDADTMHLAAGIPQLIQVTFDWTSKNSAITFGRASYAVDVDASQIIDGAKVWFDTTLRDSAFVTFSVNVFGIIKAATEGNYLKIRIYLGEHVVQDKDVLVSIITVNVIQLASYVMSTLTLVPAEHQPVTLLDHLSREIARRTERANLLSQ